MNAVVPGRIVPRYTWPNGPAKRLQYGQVATVPTGEITPRYTWPNGPAKWLQEAPPRGQFGVDWGAIIGTVLTAGLTITQIGMSEVQRKHARKRARHERARQQAHEDKLQQQELARIKALQEASQVRQQVAPTAGPVVVTPDGALPAGGVTVAALPGVPAIPPGVPGWVWAAGAVGAVAVVGLVLLRRRR